MDDGDAKPTSEKRQSSGGAIAAAVAIGIAVGIGGALMLERRDSSPQPTAALDLTPSSPATVPAPAPEAASPEAALPDETPSPGVDDDAESAAPGTTETPADTPRPDLAVASGPASDSTASDAAEPSSSVSEPAVEQATMPPLPPPAPPVEAVEDDTAAADSGDADLPAEQPKPPAVEERWRPEPDLQATLPPVPETVMVIRRSNLRVAPDPESDILTTLHPGEKLVRVDPRPHLGYYRVTHPLGEGWIWWRNVLNAG